MSNFLDKMERKFGKYAIHNLMMYVSILYVIGYVIIKVNPMFYVQYLALDFSAIFRGQVWRLITFMMLPTNTNILFLAISIYFYNFLGKTLENIWGAFKFNVYYFTGLIGTILASLAMYLITGDSWLMGTEYLNISMFMAFAVTIPDMQVLVMFLIPVRVKWLAYLDAAMLLYELVTSLISGYYGSAVAIIITFINFIVFFFAFMKRHYSPKQMMRRHKFKKAVQQGYENYGYTMNQSFSSGQRAAAPTKKITRHKCAVCGRTEADGEELEFRFCSKCNGNYEYCQDHLFTHTHVQ